MTPKAHIITIDERTRGLVELPRVRVLSGFGRRVGACVPRWPPAVSDLLSWSAACVCGRYWTALWQRRHSSILI